MAAIVVVDAELLLYYLVEVRPIKSIATTNGRMRLPTELPRVITLMFYLKCRKVACFRLLQHIS